MLTLMLHADGGFVHRMRMKLHGGVIVVLYSFFFLPVLEHLFDLKFWTLVSAIARAVRVAANMFKTMHVIRRHGCDPSRDAARDAG
jgi:hypothetical protein